MRSIHTSKKGGGGVQVTPNQAQHGRLKELALLRWTLGAVKCSEGLGWRLGTYEYCSPDLAPILTKSQERKKEKSSPPLPAASGKTSRTPLVDLKSAGSLPATPQDQEL